MSQFTQDHGFYNPNSSNGWTASSDQATYDIDPGNTSEFGVDQPFTTFEYNQQEVPATSTKPSSFGDVPINEMPYTGTLLTPDSPSYNLNSAELDDEPPLLEELGINFHHIVQKTRAALNPFYNTDASIMQDTDLAGPLVFCLAFGGLLMLSGKVHFNYIYGIGVLGCFGMYLLLNLMSMPGVSIGVVISVLGYCLLPMVTLAGAGILFPLGGIVGMCITGLAVCWCSLASSKLFVTALSMDNQQPLVAYPCAMVYGVFALLAMF